MPCKLVLFFKQFSQGWTETWYHAINDPRELIESVLTESLLRIIAKLRASTTFLSAARATQIGGAKLSFSKSYAARFAGQGFFTTDSPPDVASVDAVLKVASVAGTAKRMFIRGLRALDVLRSLSGGDTPSASLVDGLANYQSAMQAAGMTLRILDKPPNGGQTWYNVLSLSPVAGDTPHTDVTVITPILAPIVVGSQVRFSRTPFDQLPGFPSNPTVIGVNVAAPPSIRIPYFLREQATVFPLSMRLTGVSYSYSPAVKIDTSGPIFERFSEHKTGRPIGQLRGRARGKVRAL
jgi:hypothetical protein